MKKTEFQLERMILFSDAVFAIAITLLVIEIKVPHIERQINDDSILHSLIHILPELLGFILSFFTIGIYWSVHHRIFGTVENYDIKLIWINMTFLFSIVLMPFTTAVYSHFYQPNVIIPHLIYTINICLTGVLTIILISYTNNPAYSLKSKYDSKGSVTIQNMRALMMPLVLVFGLLISAFTLPWIGRMSPLLIPVYLFCVNKLTNSNSSR
ncbi:DUF1211 domain-containing protein [Dyadobacter sp. CY261]|uniref:TMEM175 family protein n=1 Tax=Dyadobacter sp. CY261 TaxID=2907203 RepID=UPI001F17BBF5|nr:TMEM175 family protein [Dyadobacter sp. CY261]MCF0072752.1 DUF1211 domain-containing protein [Dyadobacter sp. CY261]